MKHVAVAQLGARRHYAVPLAFLQQDMLEHLFTDIYFNRPLSGLVAATSRICPVPGLKRLAGRHHPVLPRKKITAFQTIGLQNKLIRRKVDANAEWLKTGQEFCRRILAYGLGDADAVYAFSSAAMELLDFCRNAGIQGILDHATAPREAELKLVIEEHSLFPGWGLSEPDISKTKEYCLRQSKEAQLASVIICGSSFVKRMLIENGVDSNKIRIVPLGIDISRSGQNPDAVRHDGLHVLFVGGDGLRKGIGYLVQAANMLKSKAVQLRAVGNLGLTAAGWSSVKSVMEVTGAVPQSEVKKHMAWADVLVLPSVSDTFGLVILEAMAAGLTVITTTSTCGPEVIRDNQDGFIISPRNADALAEKLEWLATYPEELSVMKKCAKQRASEFSLEKYGSRLAEAAGGPENA